MRSHDIEYGRRRTPRVGSPTITTSAAQLSPPVSRRRRRTLAHAPLITTPLLEPLARAHVQLAIELGRRLLAMNEVAETAADAALATIKAAAGFAEVGDGGELAVDGAAGIPARVERVTGFLRVFLVLEAHVDVADEICRKHGR
jgi:hypothetical protein